MGEGRQGRQGQARACPGSGVRRAGLGMACPGSSMILGRARHGMAFESLFTIMPLTCIYVRTVAIPLLYVYAPCMYHAMYYIPT